MKYDQAFIEALKPIVAQAGAEWCGIQECVPPSPDLLLFNSKKSRSTLAIPIQQFYVGSEVQKQITDRLTQSNSEFKGKKMNLREKLHQIYDIIDHIDKNGTNKAQNYKYVKSSDVTNAVRKALISTKVYAEINFEFVGAPYTIAREKAPNAPFSAVNVKCLVTFHDLESTEILTGSGLGSGCDTSDKAAYKAQTGALKYALKNAALAPDEADPEADESVDEDRSQGRVARPNVEPDEMPDFHEAQHAAPRPNQPRPPAQETPKPAARPTPAPQRTNSATQVPTTACAVFAEASGATVAVSSPVTAPSAPAAVVDPHPETTKYFTERAAGLAGREPGDDSDSENGAIPTEAELAKNTAAFRALCDRLSTEAKLKSSERMPINRKVIVFFLQETGAPNAKEATQAHWIDFFARVDKILSVDGGLVALRKKINKANNVPDNDEKKKK